MRKTRNTRQQQHQQQNNDFKFKFATYNLLAPNLLEENYYLYNRINPDYLDWNYRKKKIMEQIENLDSDVFEYKLGNFLFLRSLIIKRF